MAHFAQLNENNIITQVIVINNQDIIDNNGNESEELGISICKKFLGENTNWVQTSYNSNFRKRYAGIGMTYDSNRDAFIHQKPYNSWILNDETCDWEAPIPYPNDGNNYIWDEEIGDWVITGILS
jgi:hypothetical protein